MNHLFELIESNRRTPFKWGVHDCFTFTNEAWRRLNGRGWADDWAGEYVENGKPLLPSHLRRKFGAETFRQVVETRLNPVSGSAPPRGALISSVRSHRWAAGVALGICLGQSGVFVGVSGLVFHPIEYIDGAWL